MPNSNLRVPFGERDGRLFLPAEVERGLDCDCICPSCGSKLVANKPKVKRNYFSHYRSSECAGGFETALHRMGKQIIEDARQILIPSKTFEIEAHVADDYYLAETVTIPARILCFREVVSEIRADNWIPDLTATLENGRTLFIEIKVTHGVEEAKAEALDNVLEIDLSKVPVEHVRELDTLKEIVLRSADRYWYRCSLLDDAPQLSRAREALQLQVPAEKQRYLEHKQRAERVAEEKARRQEYRAVNRSLYADHIAKARKMEALDAQLYLHARMKERAGDWLIREQTRMFEAGHAERNSFPFGVGLRLQGDWIVRIYYELWQNFVMERFIINSEVGETFTVPDVVEAVGKRFGYIKWMKELADLKSPRKEKAQEYGLWCAKSGDWFLEDSEKKIIRTPYHLMWQYLKLLNGRPYEYLRELSPGFRYEIRFNKPLVRYRQSMGML